MNGRVVYSLIVLCVERSEKKKREIATSFHPEHPIFFKLASTQQKKYGAPSVAKSLFDDIK